VMRLKSVRLPWDKGEINLIDTDFKVPKIIILGG
jgi:hypothetical protein